MQLSQFIDSPSKRHPAYDDSMLYCTAPEWSTGEVLLSAAYRRLILGLPESEVDLGHIESTPAAMPAAVGGPGLWSKLLLERGGISSPCKHGQYSPLASRQLMPIVPTVARIAGVLGKRPRSRWNPSNLLLETIGAGLGVTGSAALIRQLGEAMEVTQQDDMLARFVEQSLPQGLQNVSPQPVTVPPYGNLDLTEQQARPFRSAGATRMLCPSERFCRDLPAVLAIKPLLTRRQWTVFLESVLRLGLGMHVLWTCNANIRVWELALRVADGHPVPGTGEVEDRVWGAEGHPIALLELGSDAEPVMRQLIERYAFARTGLNVLLCRLGDVGAPLPAGTFVGYSPSPDPAAPAAIAAFLAHVSSHRHQVDNTNASRWLREQVGKLFDEKSDLRSLAKCRSGYTKNLLEFARHSLGQIKAKDPEQRCYDLGYLFAYSGERKPLTVHPGPAMLLTIVHACCRENPGVPASLDDFRRYLAAYGLHVRAGELIDGKTGQDMEMLGLVIDSPDAAGGRLLVPPF